jgi:hypothetical protein
MGALSLYIATTGVAYDWRFLLDAGRAKGSAGMT